MLRQQIIKLARFSPAPARRTFSVACARAAEGDTGGMRSGGSQSGDSFSKREAAAENLFIRQRELENLKKLKEKLAMQRKHLDELDKHLEELEKESGGEHH